METNWIRFDPDDELTWPEMETECYGKTVLAYSDDRIYLAYMDLTDEIRWSLTNETEDVLVPIHCVDAWMPLPEPYKAQEALPADDQGEWLIDNTGYTCSVCGAKCVKYTWSDSDVKNLPERCPKCKSRMKRYSRGAG